MWLTGSVVRLMCHFGKCNGMLASVLLLPLCLVRVNGVPVLTCERDQPKSGADSRMARPPGGLALR